MSKMIFKNRKPNTEKLLSFGFIRSDNGYRYQADLVDGQMNLIVTVDTAGTVDAVVTDSNTGEDYVLHRVAAAAGAFIGQVKCEYEAMLEEIAAKCFDPAVFKSDQAKAVIAYVRDTYGDDLEYLWKKFPDNAIVRRKDNQKWYAALLTVSRRKLGLNTDETVEILDLRIAPEEIQNLIDNTRYFPGYHMNKNHWFTICLDNTVPTKEILAKIDTSYRLAKK